MKPGDLDRALVRLHELGDDVPAGPWRHRRASDGALLLETADGEPLALVYAGLPLARYFEATAPAELAPMLLAADLLDDEVEP